MAFLFSARHCFIGGLVQLTALASERSWKWIRGPLHSFIQPRPGDALTILTMIAALKACRVRAVTQEKSEQ